MISFREVLSRAPWKMNLQCVVALTRVSAALVLCSLLATVVWSQPTEQVLYNFKGGSDGAEPDASLVFDGAGNLYGTTYYGGANGSGTVFELTPSKAGWTETVLHSFTGSDGALPSAGLILDGGGNLYGTTQAGGAAGFGVVFELSPSRAGWTETVLYSFTGGNDGRGPVGGVVFDSGGNLYGTTSGGGYPIGGGTVFELTPSGGGWTENILYAFNASNGAPNGSGLHAGVVFDRAGNLYGTTVFGGTNYWGTIFELTPSNGNWIETTL